MVCLQNMRQNWVALTRERERERESKRLRRFVKFLFSFFFVVTLFFTVHSSAYAATRYVNSDSSGAASNPTRPFDNPSYTANDSYQTLTAAYTAASAGDTLELSGGSSGKSYLGHSGAISKANLTIRGSRISGYNGMVTINFNAGLYTVGINADNVTLDNLTINSGSTYAAIALYKVNAIIENVIVNNTLNTTSLILENTGTTNTLFQNCIIDNYSKNSVAMSAISLSTTGTMTFNNCIIKNPGYSVTLSVPSGKTVNFINS